MSTITPLSRPSTRALLGATVVFATLGAACSTSSDEADRPGDASLRAVACPFLLPEGYVEGDDISCHELETVDGDRVVSRVPVSVVHSTADQPATEPLVLQNGGPGGSPFDELAPAFETEFLRTARDRQDLVLVETRASRYSHQPLTCAALRDAESAGAPLTEQLAAAEGCFDYWRSIGVDLADIDGVDLADDIALATSLLGYETFDYYGVSFGTVIGQHLLRDHGDRLGAVVLDAVAPLGVDYLSEAPRNFDDALAVVEIACAADAGCNEVTGGSFRATLRSTMAALDAEPAIVSLPPDAFGESETVEFDGAAFAEFVFEALYSTDVTALLPLLTGAMDEPEVGELFHLIVAVLESPDAWGDGGALGLNVAATCAEIAGRAFVDDSDERPLEVDAGIDALMSIRPACDDFGFPVLADEQRTTVATDLPVLLLGGDHDPITPQRWSHDAAADMPNATVVDLTGSGHGSIEHPCGLDLILDYLDDPDAELDTSCQDDTTISFDW